MAGVLAALIAGSVAGSSAAALRSHAKVSAGTAHAIAVVNHLTDLKRPFVLPAIGKKVPKNIKVALVDCNTQPCGAAPFGPAANALGWHMISSLYDTANGPTAVQTAMTNALAQKPKFVAYNPSFPVTGPLASSIVAASQGGTVFAGLALNSNVSRFCVFGNICSYSHDGALMADIAIANAGGKTNIAVVTDPTVPTFQEQVVGAQAEMRAYGSGGTAVAIDVSLAQPAATNTATIVNALRANPKIHYVIVGALSVVSPSLPQELASAGLSKSVKIISLIPTALDMQDIRNGSIFATLAPSQPEEAWMSLYNFARVDVGEKPDTSIIFQTVVDKANVGKLTEAPDPLNYKAAFEKAEGRR